jgi:hypothetical protein
VVLIMKWFQACAVESKLEKEEVPEPFCFSVFRKLYTASKICIQDFETLFV